MMHATRSTSLLPAHSLSLLISYALLVSLLAPFTLRMVEAAPLAGVGKTPASSASTLVKKREGWRAGELLIRFRDEVSEQDRNTLAAAKGARRVKKLRGKSRLEKLQLAAGQDVRAAAAEMRLNPMVEMAEPNYLVNRDQTMSNDPQLGEQWALSNTGQSGGQAGADISAAMAWETTTGTTNTVIAIIDSGVDFTHPDLANNQWTNAAEQANGTDDDLNGLVDDLHGWDWVARSSEIKDEQGHGTLIAGLIAAEGNNAVGTAGVMWRASLMSLRVLDRNGTGDVSQAVEAIDYAVAKGAHVINCSWGTDAESISLREAIQRAAARQVLVVSSAGNGARDIDAAPYYPASFDLPNVVAVAATNHFDQLTSSSDWGATRVTVAAPGADVLTTQMGGGYRLVTGTSASAAVVSGVAGLVRTVRPLLGAADTRAAIMNGSRHVADLDSKVASGGVVSASGALGAIEGPDVQASESPTPTPEVTPSPTPTPVTVDGGGGDTGGGETGEADPPGEHGAPGANLPDLETERNEEPVEPKAPEPIHSDLPCEVCEGGGEPPPGTGVDPDFGTVRTDPINETGQPGVDLGSRNYNWGLPIINLPGRAGLDLSLSLVYNSLVWAKDGSRIRFNADRGFPGPGFRMGLPTLQQRYYNSQVGGYAYMMLTPSGGRMEFRQVGTTNVYETADSSYAQLTDNTTNNGTAGSARVRAADGAQFTFIPSVNNEMRCSEIKDRNGNFISATYNSTTGRILTITDTLGRVITFTYDANNNLTYVKQKLKSTASRTLATFSYAPLTIQTSFTGLTLDGITNGTTINVPVQIGLADGSRVNFDWTSWGQVWKISRSTPDDDPATTIFVVRSYTSYNLPLDNTTAQTDVPRFTEQRVWAEDWNGDVDGVPAAAEEALTTYSMAADDSWTEVVMPDRTTKYKELFATTGWQKGLTTGTEVYSGTVKKKWTSTLWTQDDETLAYQKNPRVEETNIYDESANRRRTAISYYPTTSYSLPMDIREYDSNATTVKRSTHYDYNLSPTYYINANQRIIGLVSRETVYSGDITAAMASKVEYQYDESAWMADETGQTNAVQHDAAYNTSFVLGRGNRTSVRRFNVEGADVVEYNTTFNSNGSAVSARDPRAHKATISYKDKYFTANTTAPEDRNTWAYPTEVTDADGYSSRAEYDFDFGVPEKTYTPSSGTGTAVTEVRMLMTYDGIGRVTKATNLENGSYTRWVYDPTLMLVKSYQTIIATNKVAYSTKVFDGAGRVRGTSIEHPTSTGTPTDPTTGELNRFSGQYFVYDKMGRLWKQSNPTEMDRNWVDAGDDAAGGWRYTLQAYDWKGRPTTTTNTDNTKRIADYDGCGCAGGEVVTVTDERGRQRKLTKDVFGRLKQVDEMNFEVNGARSVYATTTYTYDVLDNLLTMSQGSGTTARVRTFDYDGHGRLKTRTTPEQGTTTYTYNTDDTVNVMTDALGTTTTFAYNNRHMVTGVTYGEATTMGVTATPNVTYTYDAAGNRTSMTEVGFGKVDYNYNDLGQLASEERTFTEVGATPFTLSYTYNTGGELTAMSSSLGPRVNYVYDEVGRTKQVTGVGWAGVSSYVESVEYRAFGAPKSISYSNTKTLNVTYDTRLRVRQWNVSGVLGWTYSYNHFGENTGRVTFADSLNSTAQDRSYEYDQVGRLAEAQTGSDARFHVGITTTAGTGDGSYSQTYAYDKWGNMTSNQGRGGADYAPYTASFSVKNQRTGYSYDAAGNLTTAGAWTYKYNAQGQQSEARESGVLKLTQSYDGDGLRVKKDEQGDITYYLRSSLLGGQVVAELDGSGVQKRGYVYLGGQMVALQDTDTGLAGGTKQVSWVHQDPVTKSQRFTSTTGALLANKVDVDPWGGETSVSVNSQVQPHRYMSYERDQNGSDEAMHRRYNSKRGRFDQPDPWDGSYELTNPQSFNRYSYVHNDPVNFVDPTGLQENLCSPMFSSCNGLYDAAHSGYDTFWDPQPSEHIREGIDRYEKWKSDYFDREALRKLGIDPGKFTFRAYVTVYEDGSMSPMDVTYYRNFGGQWRVTDNNGRIRRGRPDRSEYLKVRDDFTEVSLTVPLGSWFVGLTFSYTWDKNGHTYVSAGPSVGFPKAGVSLVGGQTYKGFTQRYNTTPGELTNFLTGWSGNVFGGIGVGGGHVGTVGNSDFGANVVGYTSPQGGIGASYGWQIK